jgi:hypothetical protein
MNVGLGQCVPRNHFIYLKAALVERPFCFCGQRRCRPDGRADLWTAFAAVINGAFSPRGNAPSDQLDPGGRLPGMAAPTLDTQGEAR